MELLTTALKIVEDWILEPGLPKCWKELTSKPNRCIFGDQKPFERLQEENALQKLDRFWSSGQAGLSKLAGRSL